MPDYLYDIALSFLAQDEPIATQLADQFEGRLKVFLYSRKQEQLAGKDGELIFNDVFAKQTRVVVVLYRQGWGDSPWTRIEQTAIRNRAYEEGYNFTLFIPLEDRPSLPPWVPKTQLWIGLQRWGVPGAASVIDARVQELGGAPREETLEDRAARLERAVNFEAFRSSYFRSPEGIQAADVAYEQIVEQIATQVPILQNSAPSLQFEVKRQNRILVVLGSGPALQLEWSRRYSNALDEALVDVSIWRGHPPRPGMVSYSEARPPLTKLTLEPDVLESKDACWRLKTHEGTKLLLPLDAAQYIMNWWFEYVIKDQHAGQKRH